MGTSSATIFAIKRYALHDGPNIRTTIFFKGCPLHCFWCHNPEGIDPAVELVHIASRCIGCNQCVEQCSENALEVGGGGATRSEECGGCLSCVATCPALAHEATGWQMSVDQLMEEVKKDLPFYDQSGGGVTVSGGEPLSQPEPLLALLKGCGALDIHRTVDSSCFATTETLLEVALETELFLIDIKHMDSQIHRRFTGVDNRPILDNIGALAAINQPMRIRIPLIPGVNDDPDNISRTGEFVAQYPSIEGIDVLPYHSFATEKYKKLQRQTGAHDFAPPSKKQLDQAVELLQTFTADVRVGG